MSRREKRNPGSGWPIVVLLLATAIGILAYLPLVPCPTCRGAIFQERMRLARTPGIPPRQAAEIQAFAESDECGRCRRGRRTTFGFWFREYLW